MWSLWFVVGVWIERVRQVFTFWIGCDDEVDIASAIGQTHGEGATIFCHDGAVCGFAVFVNCYEAVCEAIVSRGLRCEAHLHLLFSVCVKSDDICPIYLQRLFINKFSCIFLVGLVLARKIESEQT